MLSSTSLKLGCLIIRPKAGGKTPFKINKDTSSIVREYRHRERSTEVRCKRRGSHSPPDPEFRIRSTGSKAHALPHPPAGWKRGVRDHAVDWRTSGGWTTTIDFLAIRSSLRKVADLSRVRLSLLKARRQWPVSVLEKIWAGRPKAV
jgi:hypothetical protein